MFCCCDIAFGSPCCITYNEPIYTWSDYFTCDQVQPPCLGSRLTQIGEISRVERACVASEELCRKQKVTDTTVIHTFGCPDKEVTITYYLPINTLPTGIVDNRQIEIIEGTFNKELSCRQSNIQGSTLYFINTETNEKISDWYGWWEDNCPNCTLCQKQATYSEICIIDNYSQISSLTTEECPITGEDLCQNPSGLTGSSDSLYRNCHIINPCIPSVFGGGINCDVCKTSEYVPCDCVDDPDGGDGPSP